MATFKNPNDPDNIIITEKVQEWFRERMELQKDTIIHVVEIDCADPGCMDKETRITLSFPDGLRKQFRIHKPLVFVRKKDVEQLVI